MTKLKLPKRSVSIDDLLGDWGDWQTAECEIHGTYRYLGNRKAVHCVRCRYEAMAARAKERYRDVE